MNEHAKQLYPECAPPLHCLRGIGGAHSGYCCLACSFISIRYCYSARSCFDCSLCWIKLVITVADSQKATVCHSRGLVIAPISRRRSEEPRDQLADLKITA